ncbi:DUF2298 domain-containing protein [Candidatus Amarolinea dominans]|uniref:DUF2298 domain-containing protein n=1 Tax=Candidatus Amarolinea dominans TaxID=3140696 RepID=UPI003135C3CE|nr:hypothetical protein [Anaerolineae bacterium]
MLPGTINEFPVLELLFADLHPHMMSMPFTILFLALALNLVAGYGAGMSGDLAGTFLSFIFIPLSIGALAAINTWDLPTYLGVAVLAFIIRDYRATGRVRDGCSLLYGCRGRAGLRFPICPSQNYEAVGSSGVGLVKGKTELGKWLDLGLLRLPGDQLLDCRGCAAATMSRPNPMRAPRWCARLASWPINGTWRRVATLHAVLVKQAVSRTSLAPLRGTHGLIAVALALLGYWVPTLLLLPLFVAGLLLFPS